MRKEKGLHLEVVLVSVFCGSFKRTILKSKPKGKCNFSSISCDGGARRHEKK